MNNKNANYILNLVYQLLKKAAKSDHPFTILGYVDEAMSLIEKFIKQNS